MSWRRAASAKNARRARASVSAAMRAARGSPSVSASASAPSSAVSQKLSPLTFREIESPRRVLTEKEKADKWEDLLERSARAGGTLRVGEARLMSDDPELNGEDSFLDTESVDL